MSPLRIRATKVCRSGSDGISLIISSAYVVGHYKGRVAGGPHIGRSSRAFSSLICFAGSGVPGSRLYLKDHWVTMIDPVIRF